MGLKLKLFTNLNLALTVFEIKKGIKELVIFCLI